MFWFNASLKVLSKNTLSCDQNGLTVMPRVILKENSFPRNGCSKGFTRFQINVSGGIHFQESCNSQVFNITIGRLRLAVPLEILKSFRAAISWKPAANYFHYYVIPWSFLLVTRVFNLPLFQWRHCEITFDNLFNNISSGSSTISNFSCKHKLYLLEFGLHELYLHFILHVVCGWSFLFDSFQYSVDNLYCSCFFPY